MSHWFSFCSGQAQLAISVYSLSSPSDHLWMVGADGRRESKGIHGCDCQAVVSPNTECPAHSRYVILTNNISLSHPFLSLLSFHPTSVFFPVPLPSPPFQTTSFQEISQYLEKQFDWVLAEESRIKRNPRFRDNRVHALLYFISPTGHA